MHDECRLSLHQSALPAWAMMHPPSLVENNACLRVLGLGAFAGLIVSGTGKLVDLTMSPPKPSCLCPRAEIWRTADN
jgi:hypothetical protein